MKHLKRFTEHIILQLLSEAVNSSITLYHGTPFEKNAAGIKRNGLGAAKEFIITGGDGSPGITGRSYLAKEMWNAIRYSFFKPDSLNIEWSEYIKEHPYGYVFEFSIPIDSLLPDEDAIGEMLNKYLEKGENNFLEKYIKNIDRSILNQVKAGSFDAYAKAGKIIEPKLTLEDLKKIILDSKTATVSEVIRPSKIFKVKKPAVQFFERSKDYVDWFNKYKQKF